MPYLGEDELIEHDAILQAENRTHQQETSHHQTAEKKPEQVKQSDENDSLRRPVTRSLSHSENESLTEAIPPSPSKSLRKRALRFDSVPDEKPSPEHMASTSPIKNVLKTWQEVSACSEISSPTRHSPRRLLRSVSLAEQNINGKADKVQPVDRDIQPPAVAQQHSLEKGSPKTFRRSVSVPENKSPETQSGISENLIDNDTLGRITRSKILTLASPIKNEIIPKRLTRSAAKNIAFKTESEDLPRTETRSRRRSNSDTSSNKTEHAGKIVSKSLFEKDESVIAGASTEVKDGHLDSRKTQQDFDSISDNTNVEPEQGPTRTVTRASASGSNANLYDNRDTQQNERELPKSHSTSKSTLSQIEISSDPNYPGVSNMESVCEGERKFVKGKHKIQKQDKSTLHRINNPVREGREILDVPLASREEKPMSDSHTKDDKVPKQDSQLETPIALSSAGESSIGRNDCRESAVVNEDVKAEVSSSDNSDLSAVDFLNTGVCIVDGGLPDLQGEDSERSGKNLNKDVDQKVNLLLRKNPRFLNPGLKTSYTKRPIMVEGEDEVSDAVKKRKISDQASMEDDQNASCNSIQISESTSDSVAHRSKSDVLIEESKERMAHSQTLTSSNDKPVADRSKLGQIGDGRQVARPDTKTEFTSDTTKERTAAGPSENTVKITGTVTKLAEGTDVNESRESMLPESKFRMTMTDGRSSAEENSFEDDNRLPEKLMTRAVIAEVFAEEADNVTAATSGHTPHRDNETNNGRTDDNHDELMEDVETKKEVQYSVVEHKTAASSNILMESGNAPVLVAISAQTADVNDEGSRIEGPVGGLVLNEQESDINLDMVEQDQDTGEDDDFRCTSVMETRSYPSHSRSGCELSSLFPLGLSSSLQEDTPCSSQAAQQQVVCVEAESSRTSTPTTEVMSINSMSGQVSPVSPMSFHGYDTASPLSPLSSPPQSPPVSPLIPSPNIFEAVAGFPRMLSPLPPSPGSPELESVEDVVGRSASTGVVPAGVVSQPRMISPLFPTPVPPAVSPLLEPPLPNVLSPLSDASPVRAGDFSVHDRSPMISPLRNPLIPSPCNFHAEAPRDALSVRPQHYPAARRQPASRCLAASFTATSPGISQAPEIISPRLHSLASEMVFEFGESQPSTSGLHRQQLINMVASANRETKPADQASDRVDCKVRHKDLEEQNPSFMKHGFKKVIVKSATANNKSVNEKPPETSSQAELMGQNNLDSQNAEGKVQTQPSGNDSKNFKSPKSQQKEHYAPPQTRSRNKQQTPLEDLPDHSPGRLRKKKEKDRPVSVLGDKGLVSGKTSQHAENIISRRCTRSQTGTSKRQPTDSSNARSKSPTSSSLLVHTSSKRRKTSTSGSGEAEKVQQDTASKVEEQTDEQN